MVAFDFEDYKGLTVANQTPLNTGGQVVDANAREMADRTGPVATVTAAELGAAVPTMENDSEDRAGLGIVFYVWSKLLISDFNQVFVCVDDTPGAAVWVLATNFNAYGEISVRDNAGSVSLPDINVWKQITVFATNGRTKNFTSDQANNVLKIIVPGIYRVNYGCSFEDGVNNTYERALAINTEGNIQDNSVTQRKLSANDVGDLGRSGLRYLLAKDDLLLVSARCTNTGATSIIPIHANLNAELIELA